MANEADTCRKDVVLRLASASWEAEPHSVNEQVVFTDGRIIVAGGKARRGPQRRADYILRYARDFAIAVVEAKASYMSAPPVSRQSDREQPTSPVQRKLLAPEG